VHFPACWTHHDDLDVLTPELEAFVLYPGKGMGKELKKGRDRKGKGVRRESEKEEKWKGKLH